MRLFLKHLSPASGVALASANVRRHWSRFVGAFIAVCLGVAILTMTMLVWTSSQATVPSRVDGAAIIAAGQTVPNQNGTRSELRPWTSATASELAHQLSALPGVDQAVLDRSFYAQATRHGAPVPAGDEALAAGHGWSSAALAPYQLTDGYPPSKNNDVVLDQRLGFEIGQKVSMLFGSGPRTMTVVGLVNTKADNGETVPREHPVFVTDELATHLAPGVTTIGLVLAPNADVGHVHSSAIDELGDDGVLLTSHDRSMLEPPYIAHDRFITAQLLSAMSALSTFVAIFIISSTFAANTARRRQELGLLRLIGALPGQVQRMVLVEAAITGMVGGTVGAGLGALTAPLLTDLLRRIDVLTVDFDLEYTSGPILITVIAGVVVAIVGAWLSSRQAAKITPVEAMRTTSIEDSTLTRSHWIGGGLALFSGVGISIVSVTANADQRILFTLIGAMLFTVAATLFSPMVVSLIARIVTWPLRTTRSAGPMLLRSELINADRRTSQLIAPIIATVGFAVLISGYVPTSQDAYPAAVTEQLRGQSIIWPEGRPGLTDADVNAVSTNSVIRAGLPTRVFVDSPDQGSTVLDGVGWLAPEDNGADHVVVSTLLAEKFGWYEDQPIDVGFVDGTVSELTIVAVRDINPAMAGFNLSRETVRTHDPTALTESVFVSSGSAPSDVAPGTVVYDAETYALADYHRDYWLLTQFSFVLIVVAVGYTGISVANTMVMSMQGRRNSFRVLRMSGGTVSQIVSALTAEMLVVTTVGIALGLAIALPSLAGIAAGLSETVGYPVTPRVDAHTVITVIAACFALALGASVITAWHSVKRRLSF